MGEEILVVANPSRRRRKSKRRGHRKAKRGVSPLQAMYFGGRARHNPTRRRKARKSAKRRSHRRSGGGRSLSFGSAIRSPMAVLKPAAVGAIGAIAVNTFMGRVVPMLPGAGTLLGGRVRYVTQIAAAIGLASVAGKMRVLSPATATKMAEGSLIVTMVDVIRDVSGQFGVNLGGMGYYLPGYGVRGAIGPVPSSQARPAMGVAGVGKYLTGPGAGNVVAMPARRLAGRPYGTASFSKGF